MNIFKKLFKRNTYKDFKLTDIIYNSTKICTIGELYVALKLNKEIKQMEYKENEETYHVDNIRINEETYKKIDRLLLKNLLSKKNKYARVYKEKYLRSQHSFDNLAFAPHIDNKIPNNIIRVLKINHPEYKKVKDFK